MNIILFSISITALAFAINTTYNKNNYKKKEFIKKITTEIIFSIIFAILSF